MPAKQPFPAGNSLISGKRDALPVCKGWQGIVRQPVFSGWQAASYWQAQSLAGLQRLASDGAKTAALEIRLAKSLVRFGLSCSPRAANPRAILPP